MGCCESSRPPYVPQYGSQAYGGHHGYQSYQPGCHPGQPCAQVVQGSPVYYGDSCRPHAGAYYQPGPAYQGGYAGNQNYANNGGGGMSAGMAGLAGFAGGFLAAEVIDDIWW